MADDRYPFFVNEVVARARGRNGRPIFGANAEGRAKLRAGSKVDVRQFRRDFGQPACFALFIAWPRSGHSLLGALLDAHPDMVFAHEMHACAWLFDGASREEVFYFCWQNARHHGLMGRRWHEHDYSLPGQWQGRVRRLAVLGDKKGGETSLILSQYPHNLANLRRRLGDVPLKLILAVRHPLDNIATMASRWQHENFRQIEDAIDRYRRCALANAEALQQLGDDAITVWHEDLIADPRRELTRLAGFFDVEAEPGWLAACAALVHPSANRSRDRIDWTDLHREAVRALTREFAFLKRYEPDI